MSLWETVKPRPRDIAQNLWASLFWVIIAAAAVGLFNLFQKIPAQYYFIAGVAGLIRLFIFAGQKGYQRAVRHAKALEPSGAPVVVKDFDKLAEPPPVPPPPPPSVTPAGQSNGSLPVADIFNPRSDGLFDGLSELEIGVLKALAHSRNKRLAVRSFEPRSHNKEFLSTDRKEFIYSADKQETQIELVSTAKRLSGKGLLIVDGLPSAGVALTLRMPEKYLERFLRIHPNPTSEAQLRMNYRTAVFKEGPNYWEHRLVVTVHHDEGERIKIDALIVEIQSRTLTLAQQYFCESCCRKGLSNTTGFAPLRFELQTQGRTFLEKGDSWDYGGNLTVAQPWELTMPTGFAKLVVVSQGRVYMTEDCSTFLSALREDYIQKRLATKRYLY